MLKPSATLRTNVLIDLKPQHSLAGPLTSGKIATEGGTRSLIETLNHAAKEPMLDKARLGRAFDTYWPDLERRIASLSPAENAKAKRSPDEMVGEILKEVRKIARAVHASSTSTFSSLSSFSSDENLRKAALLASYVEDLKRIFTIKLFGRT